MRRRTKPFIRVFIFKVSAAKESAGCPLPSGWTPLSATMTGTGGHLYVTAWTRK